MPGNERGGWMQTVTGKCFYPLFPNRDDIEIQDIAFGLAGEFRFGNQCHQRYTVAQHCVHVAEIVPAHAQLHALLHDAAEAYLHDIIRPVKHLPELAAYRAAENNLQALIYQKFCGTAVEPPEVNVADTRMLGIEARDLMVPLVRPEEWEWCIGPVRGDPLRIPLVWPVDEAEDRWLDMFVHLTKYRSNEK